MSTAPATEPHIKSESFNHSIDKYKYPGDNGVPDVLLRKFLWFCAGADLELLRKCPESERIKEEGIGGVVLATAILAFFSSAYAFYIVFKPKIGIALSAAQQTTHLPSVLAAIGFGTVWALVIFNLDRFIVSSGGHGDGTEKITWGEFKGALPRLVMALIIGFTLSKPLEIRVMESELDAILSSKQRDYVSAERPAEDERHEKVMTNLNAKVQEIKDAKLKKQTNIDDLSKREREEREIAAKDASGGFGHAGIGPGTKTHLAAADNFKEQREQAMEEFKNFEGSVQSDLKRLEAAQDEENTNHDNQIKLIEAQANNLDGLLNRITWAHEKSPVSSWMLTLLLLVIEVAPIFYKLMIRNGPYHYLSENQKEIVIAKFAIERSANLNANESTQEVETVVYHQAVKIYDSTMQHLNSEASLSALALQEFHEAMEKDVKENLDKYVAHVPADTGFFKGA